MRRDEVSLSGILGHGSEVREHPVPEALRQERLGPLGKLGEARVAWATGRAAGRGVGRGHVRRGLALAVGLASAVLSGEDQVGWWPAGDRGDQEEPPCVECILRVALTVLADGPTACEIASGCERLRTTPRNLDLNSRPSTELRSREGCS